MMKEMQAPAGLNVLSIPSPMHSSSRRMRLPSQIFTSEAQGVAVAESPQCITPSDAMMQCSTPVAIATPSNVATTHWRTMVCPGAPQHPASLQAARLQRFGSMESNVSSNVSSISPASRQWPSMPATPHRYLSFGSSNGNSVPSTPTGVGLNTAFIASTPVHEGDVTMFDGEAAVGFCMPPLGSEATPQNSSMRGTLLLAPQPSRSYTRLLSM